MKNKKLIYFFCGIIFFVVNLDAAQKPNDGKIYPFPTVSSPFVSGAFSLNQNDADRAKKSLDLLRYTSAVISAEYNEERRSDSEHEDISLNFLANVHEQYKESCRGMAFMATQTTTLQKWKKDKSINEAIENNWSVYALEVMHADGKGEEKKE